MYDDDYGYRYNYYTKVAINNPNAGLLSRAGAHLRTTMDKAYDPGFAIAMVTLVTAFAGCGLTWILWLVSIPLALVAGVLLGVSPLIAVSTLPRLAPHSRITVASQIGDYSSELTGLANQEASKNHYGLLSRHEISKLHSVFSNKLHAAQVRVWEAAQLSARIQADRAELEVRARDMGARNTERLVAIAQDHSLVAGEREVAIVKNKDLVTVLRADDILTRAEALLKAEVEEIGKLVEALIKFNNEVSDKVLQRKYDTTEVVLSKELATEVAKREAAILAAKATPALTEAEELTAFTGALATVHQIEGKVRAS